MIHTLLLIAVVLFVLWLLFHGSPVIWLAIAALVVLWLVGFFRRSTT